MAYPGAVPASLGKRALAYLIDALAAFLLGGAFAGAGAWQVWQATGDTPTGATTLMVVGLGLLAVLGLVQWWFNGTRGITLGKVLVGLRLVDADTGRPVGLGRALVRGLVVAAGAVVVAVGQVVVLASPLFDASGRRQGWHDKAARALVVDVVTGEDPTRGGDTVAAARLDGLLAPVASVDLPPAPVVPAPVVPAPVVPSDAPLPPAPVDVPLPPAPVEQPAPPQGAPLPPPPVAPPVLPAPEPPAPPVAAPAPPAPPVAAPEPPAPPAPPVPAEAWAEPAPTAPDILAPFPAAVPPVDSPFPRDPEPVTPPAPPAPAAPVPAEVSGAVVPEPPAAPALPADDDATGIIAAAPGVISAVPGARPAPPVPPLEPTVLVDHVPVGLAVRTADEADGAATDTEEDLEDLEATRLSLGGTTRARRPQDGPPRAVLHLWDGEDVTIEGFALVGRNPVRRDDEPLPERVIAVPDTRRSVSKTHLAVGVDAAGTWVRDRGSTNGTVVTLPDGAQVICAPGQVVRVPVGATVSFGDFWFTVS